MKIPIVINRTQNTSFEIIERKVENSLSRFISNDSVLISYAVKEEALSHRIACYLQNTFSNLDVDCEYNKFGENDKMLDGKGIRPDIIIHKRGDQIHNLLAIEVKKKLNPSNNDITKLKGLTNQRGKYKYAYGLFLGFSKNMKGIMVYYHNRQEIKRVAIN